MARVISQNCLTFEMKPAANWSPAFLFTPNNLRFATVDRLQKSPIGHLRQWEKGLCSRTRQMVDALNVSKGRPEIGTGSREP
jgi:hypothetical protein